MIVDRIGFEYAKLLEIQKEHLAVWKKRVIPAHMNPIKEYVLSMNREARTANDKHQVFRGQDLIEIIRVWPEVEKNGFPGLPKVGEDFI